MGVDGLSAAVIRCRDSDVGEIAKNVIDGAKHYSGNDTVHDDQCVVVVRVGSNALRQTTANRAPTIDIVVQGDGANQRIEFTVVNSIDAIAEISNTLRPKALEWVRVVEWGGDFDRLWLGAFESIVNSFRHATRKGERIRLTLTVEGPGVVIELEQPSEWRDWDKSLGPDRRSLVDSVKKLKPDMDQLGTLLMLWYADNLEVLRQGRLIRMTFREEWRRSDP